MRQSAPQYACQSRLRAKRYLALIRTFSKAACLFELYLSGVSFYVLPDDFLIHQSHEYAEAARKNERRYNRKLYLDVSLVLARPHGKGQH